MKIVYELIDNVEDELEDAKAYAEHYITHKAIGSDAAGTLKKMSEDELQHAAWVLSMAERKVSEIESVMPIPEPVAGAWEKCKSDFPGCVSRVRNMLSY